MLQIDDFKDVSKEIITDSDKISHVLKKIRERKNHFLGYYVKITKTTMCVGHEPKCRNCGKKLGKIVVSPSHGMKDVHLKFFTKDNVNLTKDHVIPVSKGGSGHRLNLQTLCYFCNEEKDCTFNGKVKKAFSAKHVRQIFNYVGRPDLISLMVDKIKKRKEENHPTPQMFTIDKFLDEFPVFTKKRLMEIVGQFEDPYHELPKKNLKTVS